MTATSDLRLRRAGADDLDAIIGLAGDALGWDMEQPNAAWFRWKHLDNPFGPSPMWVAEDAAGLVGFRTFLRWELRRGETVVHAVRAVDTATAPAAQGRGVFTALTNEGLEGLAAEGVRFVFNTPNDRSRPGYLKMGWQVVGRPRTSVRPRSLPALVRLAQARTPAEKFSLPCEVGRAAGDVFTAAGSADAVERLARSSSPRGRVLTTNRTVAYLAWRYGFEPLHYRVLTGPDGVDGGCLVFRLRRRGSAVEATIAEVLVPERDRHAERRLLADVRRQSRADYLLRLDPSRFGRAGFVTVPRLGPVLTWRGVTEWVPPRLAEWDLALGDLELL